MKRCNCKDCFVLLPMRSEISCLHHSELCPRCILELVYTKALSGGIQVTSYFISMTVSDYGESSNKVPGLFSATDQAAGNPRGCHAAVRFELRSAAHKNLTGCT